MTHPPAIRFPRTPEGLPEEKLIEIVVAAVKVHEAFGTPYSTLLGDWYPAHASHWIGRAVTAGLLPEGTTS
jgi:hypothetical protein